MKPTRLAVIGLCLPILACYEEPVRDHLHIHFTPGQAIIVTAVRDIAPPSSAGDNPAVEDRVDEARTDLASGWDRWSQGFVEIEDSVERPPVSLWRSLENMVGHWIEPDLITALVRPGPDEFQPEPDPVSFASLRRRWAPAPDPTELETEIRNRLRPEPVYLIRWQTRTPIEDEDEVYGQALQMLRTAEQDLPD